MLVIEHGVQCTEETYSPEPLGQKNCSNKTSNETPRKHRTISNHLTHLYSIKNKTVNRMRDYTKLRWTLALIGLVLYVVDIGSDVGLALQYFKEGDYAWGGLTLAFVLTGLVGTQVFSYAWYSDEMKVHEITPDDKDTGDNIPISSMTDVPGMSINLFFGLHLFGMGIFTRYYRLLKKGFPVVWSGRYSPKLHNQVSSPDYANEEKSRIHKRLVDMATDLSMLIMFEAFLEGAPQLMLQVYVMLRHDTEASNLRYVTTALSFCSISWALVDYQRWLRRSLPQVNEMPCGFPLVFYLLYKLFTITAHILSYCLFLTLSTYSVVAFAFIWLLGTIWAYLLKTDFCGQWTKLEWLYRAMIGVVLTFSFFNAKGKETKFPMIFYYLLHFILNTVAPILLALSKPEVLTCNYFLPVTWVIFGGTVLGLICLCVYYAGLHPSRNQRAVDEPDGLEKPVQTAAMQRMRNFMQP